MRTAEVFAPAKVNLALHITGRRADGYHLIDSLVVFADFGDRLAITIGEARSLTVTGPFAAGVPTGDDNLVVRAARMVAPDADVSIMLDKRLPPASGIGGGSADAAAVVRGLDALSGAVVSRIAGDLLPLGADVPMCLGSEPARAGGIGERIVPLSGLPELAAVLVNPGVPVSTPQVFAALQHRANPPMSDQVPRFADADAFLRWLSEQRNDLEPAAIAVAPVISDVLASLRAVQGVELVRLSGSGATCFGLFTTRAAADRAAAVLSRDHPGWWIVATSLGAGAAELARPVIVA